MKLLGTGNSKTMKGEKRGFLTFILHLAPASLSGYNVCPMSSSGCRAACLNTAGRGKMSKVQEARIRKTLRFFEDRSGFMADLVSDVHAAIRKADRKGMVPCIRLNGTSDIRWENIPAYQGEFPHPNIMTMFPDVQFYDYTKLSNRRNLPDNYHLVFSRSETNEHEIGEAICNGMNIAVVFSTPKGEALPTHWRNSLEVVDGDENDLRFLDPCCSVIGLRAKGDGKKDDTGFVVNV